MDKLKTVLEIIEKKAAEQRQSGEIPTILGVRGMLALMFDRICSFSKEGDDVTEFVIDLAVKSVFAVMLCIPDVDFDTEPQEVKEEVGEEDDLEATIEADDRWTPVNPGASISSVKSDDDDSD